jgi:peptidoglycan pentaglycine glycine transferase (the first glycine)
MASMSDKTAARAATFKRETSPATWDQALARLPYAHALQSWAWGQFKARWGWRSIPLTMSVGGNGWEAAAAAHILRRDLPRTPYCVLYVPKGPALNYADATLRRHVLAQLEHLARRERAVFIKIDPEVVQSWGLENERVSPLGAAVMRDLAARGWRPSVEQIQFRNTVELPLESTEEQLLAAMKQKTRYNIRLAERKGVSVRPGTTADLPTIAAMYQETGARDGFTTRPSEYYLDGWSALYERRAGPAALLAEFEGRPIAAVILVRFADRVIYMYGASRDEARERMPNHLLQWEAIRWARAQGWRRSMTSGARRTCSMRADRLWGVWRFKAGFNGEVVRFIGAWDYHLAPTAVPAVYAGHPALPRSAARPSAGGRRHEMPG